MLIYAYSYFQHKGTTVCAHKQILEHKKVNYTLFLDLYQVAGGIIDLYQVLQMQLFLLVDADYFIFLSTQT